MTSDYMTKKERNKKDKIWREAILKQSKGKCHIFNVVVETKPLGCGKTKNEWVLDKGPSCRSKK